MMKLFSEGHIQVKKPTKEEAIAAGLIKYWTGVQCANGHLTFRYVSNGDCVSCIRDRNRKATGTYGDLDDNAVQRRRAIEDRACMKHDEYDYDIT